ncbi:PucR family transcriptional regulator [Mycobacterium branderi]|uniref:Transcriptional regulator n=1 Tax=Mycobacterium branderi TaxID=43348 RepID=A0A7I7WF52_9MYCO|nr:helix-turn-helix domain-containing protein [Mycobacterium branderi]MCV7236346.1 helix-turn-helix domain-containing protein [Mycobacterium branderi]ORA35510.1 hypothetical protein BST20_18180 [Mycobacterium branderi]BBZ15231.1 transcriptional regulator [Mycobacterium branderi]
MDVSTVDAMDQRGSTGMPLSTLLADLAPGVLDVVVTPREPQQEVTTVQIWEPECDTGVAAGAMVFAVGPSRHEVERLLSACESASAAAIVVRATETGLAQRAAESGLWVLAPGSGITWDRAAALVRAALAASGDQQDGHPWDGGTDLFELADAAALALGAPVDVTDHRLRLMAFSSMDEACEELDDQLRVKTILHRRVPEEVGAWLRANGQLTRLIRATEPVPIVPPGHRPRLAMPLRAGPEVIGYLWLLPFSGSLDDSATETARDIARVFAGRLARAVVADRQRHASDLLRGVLDGRLVADALSTVLDASDTTQLRVIGFGSHDDAPLHHVDRCHLESLVATRIQSLGSVSVTAMIGNTVYALVGTGHGPMTGLRSLSDDIVVRAGRQLGVKLVAVIGGVKTKMSELRRAGAEIDRALRIHAHAGGGNVVTLDDISLHCILHELAEVTEERPHLLAGSLEVLAEFDQTKNTAYIPTLLAYFDANCDLAGAANAMYLHRNTIRYRLQRMRDICGLDLDDPLDRLVTEMQLRLLMIRKATDASAH